MAGIMRLVDTYLDVSQPDPPIRGMESIRVSHLMAHPCDDPYRSTFQQLADEFGLSEDAVLAAASYYMQHRTEIERAIEYRNAEYREGQG